MLELPSTALLAPCAAESAELLALIALRLATFVAAAVAPFWLKQYCPALPDFNWPPSNGHVLHTRKLEKDNNEFYLFQYWIMDINLEEVIPGDVAEDVAN